MVLGPGDGCTAELGQVLQSCMWGKRSLAGWPDPEAAIALECSKAWWGPSENHSGGGGWHKSVISEPKLSLELSKG